MVHLAAHCAVGIPSVRSKVKAASGLVLMFTLHLLEGKRTLPSALSAVTSPTQHSRTSILLGQSLPLSTMRCLHSLTATARLLAPYHLSGGIVKQVKVSQRAPQDSRCFSKARGDAHKDQSTADSD